MKEIKLDFDLLTAERLAEKQLSNFRGSTEFRARLQEEIGAADMFARINGTDAMAAESSLSEGAPAELTEEQVFLQVVTPLESVQRQLEIQQRHRNFKGEQARYRNQKERARLAEQGQQLGTSLVAQGHQTASLLTGFSDRLYVMLVAPIIEEQNTQAVEAGLDGTAHLRFMTASELTLQRVLGANPQMQEMMYSPLGAITLTGGYTTSGVSSAWLGYGDVIGDEYVEAFNPEEQRFSRRLTGIRTPGEVQAHSLGRAFASNILEAGGARLLNKAWAEAPPTPHELRAPEQWIRRVRL
ncbi:MAG: hypothetical protein HOQ05_03100 [Corynebacteriales bacterium]|nr:hypothetical protein [Mycobacteriales bacterium]